MSKNGAADRLRRRTEAEARKQKSDAMTPEQRIQALDRTLGVGLGAKKERAKLAAKMKPGSLQPGNLTVAVGRKAKAKSGGEKLAKAS